MEKTFGYIRKGAAMLLNILFPMLTAVVHFQFILFGRLTEASARDLCWVIAAVSFFAYYSLFKQGVKYDTDLRDRYLDAENQNLFTALKIAFTSPYLWIVSAVTALEFFLIKISAFAVVFNNGAATALARLKIAGICLPLFLVLGVIAFLTASRDWKKDGRDSKKYSAAAYYEQMAIAVGAYLIGGVVLVYLFPYFSGLTGIFKGLADAITLNGLLTGLSVIAALIIVPPVIRSVRGLLKRKSFFKQLERVCREKGYTLSEIKVPYKSLFQPYAGESFTIQTDKKTYSCKLICGMKKRIPMVLYEDGTGEYIHAFHIGKKGAQIEIFRYVKKFSFAYESENDKILIVLPVPKFMQMNKAGKIFDMDNGEIIGQYRMYAGTGFINALDRECVDGAKNKNIYKYI